MPRPTVMGLMLRELRERGASVPDGWADESTRAFVNRLVTARTITISPTQAVASAAPADGSQGALALPFRNVLLDFGSGLPVKAYHGDRSTPARAVIVGTLLWRGCEHSMNLVAIGYGQHMAMLSKMNRDASPALVAGPRLYDMIVGIQNLLECANVELVESDPYPKGHVAAGQPRYEVVVRTGGRSAYPRRDDHQAIDYSHRFEVRGNFAHYYETTVDGRPSVAYQRMLARHPEKLVEMVGDDGVKRSCFRIWRPDYVKGPEDKPLIPKLRVVR